jgi:hypothetical protein
LAIIRLYVQRVDTATFFPRTFLDEDGRVQELPRLRLLVTGILLGPDPAERSDDPGTMRRWTSVSIFPPFSIPERP